MKTKLSKFSFFLFGIILLSYILVRCVFFNEHGMKDIPDTLALIASALTALFILTNKKVSAFASSIGYIVGYLIGIKTHKTYIDLITGKNDNLWLIWIISYAIIIIVGFIIDTIMFHVKHKEVK